MKQRFISLVCLLMAAVLVFAVAGCNKEAANENTPSGTEATSEITPEPSPGARNGGWLDEITFAVISQDTAVLKFRTAAWTYMPERFRGLQILPQSTPPGSNTTH